MNRNQHTLTVILALIAGLVGGVVSSQFLMGQRVFAEKKAPHHKVIKAEKFEVVDSKDQEVGWLKHDKGGAWLFLETKRNSDGFSSAVSLGVRDTEAFLHLVNRRAGSLDLEANLSRTALRLFGGGGGAGYVQDKYKAAIIMESENDANPSLELFDKDGNSRAVLGTTELKHKDTGSTEVRAPSSLVLFDEKGKVLWSAP